MKNQSHCLRGGKLQLHRRKGSRFWQCAASFEGKRVRESTQQIDLEYAKDFAEDWYDRLKSRQNKGLLKYGGKSGTFAEAAEGFLYEYAIQNKREKSEKWVRGHEIKLRLHLLPFFGKMLVDDITPGTAQDYRIYRMTPKAKKNPLAKDNRPHKEQLPAYNTIHNEIVTLRMVLNWAERHRWIRYAPNVAPAYRKTVKISPRPWFSPPEYKQLYTATRLNATNARQQDKWAAEQLHDYILFVANTGLRPDEANNLQHRDVEVVDDEDTDETILVIEVRGKRGFGYCKSTAEAVKPYLRLKNRPKVENDKSSGTRPILPSLSDHLFPSDHRKAFNTILIREGLKFGRDGQSRTSHSLRHTYICLRLIDGADIYQLAKNCRTSVEMIEKYYASHIKNTINAAAINIRRPRRSSW